MKLTISNIIFLEHLSNVIGAIEKKHTNKILENILFQATQESLTLVATDLEIELSSSFDMAIEKAGEVTVPAKKLFDICKALPADSVIVLESDENNRIHIIGNRSKFTLSTLPADDYPLLDQITFDNELELPENDFKDILDDVSFSMANLDVRYYLNGLLLEFNQEQMSAVSTDGHRLAISTYTNETFASDLDTKLIIPRKGVLELSRLLDATSKIPLKLQVSQNHIRIYKGNIQFTSKLIDGNYPDYQAAIPSSCNHKISLDKSLFKSTLARVAILSNEKFRGIRLVLNNGIMSLFSNNPDNETAEEELDINYSGETFEIGFNVTYLLDAVNHLSGDEIFIDLLTPNSSALLYSKEKPDTRYVVMPIRL